jgi:hypothetical protein
VVKGESLFNLKTVENFISKEDAEEIIFFVNKIKKWEDSEGTSFWSNRGLSDRNIYNNFNKDMGKYLYDLRIRIGEAIKDLYGVEEIFPDLLQVIRWFPGMEQPPHADDMSDTENNEWFHHRHFGAVIYLNDDYSGGETYYPQHNESISAEIGKLVIHPGSPDHMHGVKRVEGNTRYTIASFWTKDRSYFDGWTLPE